MSLLDLVRKPVFLVMISLLLVVGVFVLLPPKQGTAVVQLAIHLTMAWASYRIWRRAGFTFGAGLPNGLILFFNMLMPVCWIVLLISVACQPWPAIGESKALPTEGTSGQVIA